MGFPVDTNAVKLRLMDTFMGAEGRMVAAMVAIMNEHQQSARNQRCSCGWRGDVSKSVIDPNNIYQQHRKHLAQMLIAAGFIRG